MKIIKYLLLLAVSCLLPAYIYAQDFLLRQYTVKDGLPSNTVYSVFQDSKGFIWFTTDQGISRFDGHSFANYTTRDGLPDNEVFALKEDKQGRIWISSYNAKISFIQNGQIFNASNSIICRLIEQDSILQKVRLDAGITPPHILMKGVAEPARRLKGFSYFNVTECIHLFHSYGEDLFFIHGYICLVKNGKARTIFSKCNRAYYKDGFLYLCHMDNERLFISKALYNTDTVHIVKSLELPFTTVYEFATQDDSTLLLGTDRGALPFVTSTGNADTHKMLLKTLPVNTIRVDIEGNSWFTTLNHGVYFLSASRHTVYKIDSGMAGVITVLPSGIPSCGYDGKGVQVLDKARTRFFKLPEQGIKNRILKLAAVSGTKLIVGTDYGLYSIDVVKNTVKILKNHLLSEAVKDIYVNGKSLFLTGVHGAAEIDSNGNLLHKIWQERTTAIAVSDSIIWLGTLQGVYQYTPGGGIEKPVLATLLSQSRITDIEIAENGDVIFLTHQAGIFVWNGQTVQQLDENTGLSSNICRRVFLDDKHNIWILTNEGIDRLLQKNNRYTVAHYGLSNGLLANHIADIAVSNNKLYISCADGIVELDMKKEEPQRHLQVYITSVALTDTTIANPQDIRLSYKQSDLTINYTALAFNDGQNVTYRYIIEGGDADTVITKLTSVNLSAISPGEYVFKVWAKGSNGVWTSTPAMLSVTIAPPFWLKNWFIVLVFSAVAMAIYLLVKRRINIIRKTERTKTELNKKLAKLEMQALRAQINPHFIFNALNAIQNYYNINDERNANRYMTMFANLIRRTLSHSKDNWIEISEEISMLRTYIELEKMRFKNVFDYEVHISESINAERTKIPAMIIQLFVENAINHGLRHLNGRLGKLRIDFLLIGQDLICIIEDNGVGFKQAAFIEKDARNHKSMGMSITSGRIHTMNLLYNISINVNVIHKDTPDDSGTIIKITIPITKAVSDE